MPIEPFNPLDKRNLGDSVAKALLERPAGPLPPPEPFAGAGVYAIYYRGDNPLYVPMAGGERPIYVGKAVPPGARKGGFGLGLNPGNTLFSRLVEHSRSIESTETLRLPDFECRFLIADDIWIPLGESLLIERFKPIWNVLVTGFGNHDPGQGRYRQQRSEWDTVHPGRSWAARLEPNPRTNDEIANRIAQFLAGRLDAELPPEQAVENEE